MVSPLSILAIILLLNAVESASGNLKAKRQLAQNIQSTTLWPSTTNLYNRTTATTFRPFTTTTPQGFVLPTISTISIPTTFSAIPTTTAPTTTTTTITTTAFIMTTSSSTFQSTIPSTLLMMTAAQTLTTIASTTSPSNAAGVVLLQRTISSQAVATSTLTTSDPETSSSGGISNGGIAGVVVGVAATIVAGIAIFAFRKSAVLPTQKFRNKLNPPPLVDVPSDSTIGGGSGGNQPLLTAPAAAAAVATGPEVSRTESVASRRPLSFGSNGSSSNYYSRQEIVVMPSPLQSPDRTTMIQNHQQQPQFTNLHDFPEDVISSGPGVHMAMYEDQEPFVYSDSPVVVLNGYAPSLGSSYGQPASNYDHLRPQSPIIPPAVLPFVYNTPNVYQQQQQHLHQLNPIYQSQQQPTVNIDQSYVPLHVTNGMPLGSNYGTRMDD